MNKGLFLGLLMAGCLLAGQVSANCSWMVNANCSDVSYTQQAAKGTISCAQQNKSNCNNASNASALSQLNKYSSLKCCCCGTAVGCCSYNDINSGAARARQTTIDACFGYVYFAKNIKFDVNATAKNNTCVPTMGCCLCRGPIDPITKDRPTNAWATASDKECQTHASTFSSCYYDASKVVASPGSCGPRPATVENDTTPLTQDSTTEEKNTSAAASAEVSVKIDPIGQENPLQTFDVAVLAGRIINGLMVILGTIAFVITVYAGFMWMTAQGNEKKIQTSQKTIIWMAAGLVLIFLAYVVVKFMLELVGK